MSPWTVRLPPVLLAAVLVHTAVSPNLRLFGVAVDVLLLLTIAAAIAGGAERGAAVGFACGLLADCFLQTPFGLSALDYALVGYGVGVFQTGVLHSSWWIPAITGAVASVVAVVGFVLLGVVVGQDQLVSTRLIEVAAVIAVLHAALAPLAVRLMRWALAESTSPTLIAR
ncbi:MAG: rod shape-determining protein MreD [Actinomycetota bacterium]|nr:rod shape-determining protein MreD [Actinomycetota bacterium]